ncbi:hypothetical protein BASA50_007593 [Batrachochytrium salamandrivorans]|uniref:Uncharacterized protein n=1 Tax=Batrachochytrium salamandrivorans TaxID=1357716 RepID=A0ABQ8F6N1_9FUNG|nr:hypothetical protein BASA50_007593 [Batrachochytrium salamandrivorans]
MMVDEQEKLDEQGAQVKIDLQNEIDKDKEKESVGPHNSWRNPYGHRHSGADNSGDGSKELPKPSQKGRGFRDFFTRKEKDKPRGSFNSFKEKNKLQSFFKKDNTDGPVESSGSFENPYKDQPITINNWGEDPVGPHKSWRNPYGYQHSGADNSGDGSKELPKPSQKGRGFRNFFTRTEKDKPRGSFNSFKEKNKLQSFFKKDNTNGPVESSGFLEEVYTPQRKIEAMGKSNQELLKKQDEITSGGSFNKKLPETQAQEVVQPSGMPQTNPVSLCLSVTSIAHLVVECEQVAGHRIQSGLVPEIQKSRLRLLGRALDPGVENVYTWLRGGVLNGEADLDQRWLDGTVEHEFMGTRHANRALAARLADFRQVAYRQYQSTLWKYHRDRLVEVG